MTAKKRKRKKSKTKIRIVFWTRFYRLNTNWEWKIDHETNTRNGNQKKPLCCGKMESCAKTRMWVRFTSLTSRAAPLQAVEKFPSQCQRHPAINSLSFLRASCSKVLLPSSISQYVGLGQDTILWESLTVILVNSRCLADWHHAMLCRWWANDREVFLRLFLSPASFSFLSLSLLSPTLPHFFLSLIHARACIISSTKPLKLIQLLDRRKENEEKGLRQAKTSLLCSRKPLACIRREKIVHLTDTCSASVARPLTTHVLCCTKLSSHSLSLLHMST